jgi:hypothetical protein
MSTGSANPLGAAGDLTKAATAIGAILRPEPQGQPKKETQAPAVQEANPSTDHGDTSAPVKVTMLKDPKTGRFVKAEPETEENTRDEGEDVQSEPETQTAQPTEQSDSEELADTAAGLAAQLGLSEDELLDHLKLTVKVNGEEKPANLRELRNGYQMESDYRTKTAALADEKRAFESERSAITQQRDHYASQLQPFLQQLESLVADDSAHLQQLLQEGDLLGFERAKAAAEQRRVARDTAKQELSRIDEQRQSEARQKLERDVADNERKLGELRPDWAKDPEKGKKEIASIRQYLKGKGMPGEMVDTIYDANSLIIAEQSMKYEQLLAEKSSRLNEVKLAPKKFLRAGPAKPAVDPVKQVHRANLQKLRRSGNMKDAALALRSGGFLNG